jgi:hypothetical protein
MPTKDELTEELDWITNKISALVWVLNLGTLGITWSLLITTTIPDRLKITFVQARWIFLLSLLALLFELLQYLSAYFMCRKMQKAIENERSDYSLKYDVDSWLYKWRLRSFYLKIGLTISASVLLLAFILLRLS